MANLNFQQAPRSLASGGVGGRVSSGLVGGVSGHVTPTFGGALSPGRNSTAMPGGAPPSMASRSTLFGQRAFADRRVPIPNALSQPNSNSMVRKSIIFIITFYWMTISTKIKIEIQFDVFIFHLTLWYLINVFLSFDVVAGWLQNNFTSVVRSPYPKHDVIKF